MARRAMSPRGEARSIEGTSRDDSITQRKPHASQTPFTLDNTAVHRGYDQAEPMPSAWLAVCTDEIISVMIANCNRKEIYAASISSTTNAFAIETIACILYD
ncbi:unnamed protein product [Toxocara canis]|uniref:Uncharacterized protein n=1 Tax=Toxocara canis TaxID=6265 RepID=A0A183V2C2_TOXCA|nr:unnamed protein product [Toxocara canis]